MGDRIGLTTDWAPIGLSPLIVSLLSYGPAWIIESDDLPPARDAGTMLDVRRKSLVCRRPGAIVYARRGAALREIYIATEPYHSADPTIDAEAVAAMIQQLGALMIPSYLVANLPPASAYPNGLVRIEDNPQGTAQSNGVAWISDVDGSNLGPGGDG